MAKKAGTEFLEYDPNLRFWSQPRLLRGLLSILAVSAIMIWVEVSFHRFVLLPEGNASIKNKFRCMHGSLDKPVDEMTKEEQEELFGKDNPLTSGITELSGSVGQDKAILRGLYNMEKTKLDKANMYAYLSMFIPWFVVIALMVVIWNRLNSIRYRHHVIPIMGIPINGVVVSVFVSILIFSVFQIIFYNFGVNFKYASEAELVSSLEKSTRERLFIPFVPSTLRSILGLHTYYDYDNPYLVYNGGNLMDPNSWSRAQKYYPKPLDESTLFYNPITENSCIPYYTDIYEREGYTGNNDCPRALYETKYQTSLNTHGQEEIPNEWYCNYNTMYNKYNGMDDNNFPNAYPETWPAILFKEHDVSVGKDDFYNTVWIQQYIAHPDSVAVSM